MKVIIKLNEEDIKGRSVIYTDCPITRALKRMGFEGLYEVGITISYFKNTLNDPIYNMININVIKTPDMLWHDALNNIIGNEYEIELPDNILELIKQGKE